MKRIANIVLVLLLAGYALFRQNQQTAKSSIDESLKSQANSSTQTNLWSNRNELRYRTDSIGADYKIYFWPRGQLNLSAEGGFTGEFDSVLLFGKRTQLSDNLRISNENKDFKEQKSTSVEQSHQLNSAQKIEKKSGFSALSILGLVTIIIIFTVLIAKYRYSVRKRH